MGKAENIPNEITAGFILAFNYLRDTRTVISNADFIKELGLDVDNNKGNLSAALKNKRNITKAFIEALQTKYGLTTIDLLSGKNHIENVLKSTTNVVNKEHSSNPPPGCESKVTELASKVEALERIISSKNETIEALKLALGNSKPVEPVAELEGKKQHSTKK